MGFVSVAIRVVSMVARKPPSHMEDMTRRSSAVLFSLFVALLPPSVGFESVDELEARANVPLSEDLLCLGMREVFSLVASGLIGSSLSSVGEAMVG